MRSLHALRFTSILCVCSVGFLACIIIYKSVVDGRGFVDPGSVTNAMMWPASVSGVIYVFPIFSISFLCHFNALSTQSELVLPKRRRVHYVVHMTVRPSRNHPATTERTQPEHIRSQHSDALPPHASHSR